MGADERKAAADTTDERKGAADTEEERSRPPEVSGRGRDPEPRLLLVRSEHLGDVLLTLPAAVALRRALPRAHIAYLVPGPLRDVPARCPAVDEVLTVPFPPAEEPWDPPRWTRVVEGVTPALRGRFDAALLFRPADPWAGTLALAAGVPLRFGYSRPETSPFLTAAVSHRAGRHAVEAAMDLAALAAERFGADVTSPPSLPRPWPPAGPHDAGREDRGCRRVLVTTADDEAEADAAVRRVPGLDARPVVLHPGTGWGLKQWPPERWGRLADELRDRRGVRPLVTGIPAEGHLVDAVVHASRGGALRLEAPLSLGGFAALVRRARLLIAADSGPLHLAALLGTRVVGLYGPVGPLESGPWCQRPRRRVVAVSLPCSPCGSLDAPPCGASAEPRCVTDIGIGDVLAPALELLPA